MFPHLLAPLLGLTLAGLTACAEPAQAWSGDMVTATCATYQSCDWLEPMGYADVGACETAMAADGAWTCADTLDEAAAADCHAALSGASCHGINSGATDLSACSYVCADA